jgi:hypothetical protein
MKEHSSLIKDLTSNSECEKFKLLSLQQGPLYTRSQCKTNLGPTLNTFELQIGPKLLINARTLT